MQDFATIHSKKIPDYESHSDHPIFDGHRSVLIYRTLETYVFSKKTVGLPEAIPIIPLYNHHDIIYSHHFESYVMFPRYSTNDINDINKVSMKNINLHRFPM